MTPVQWGTLSFVADRPRDPVTGRVKTVDLREISEPLRQRIIDLGMMDPPLVQVDADQVSLTDDGERYIQGQDRP